MFRGPLTLGGLGALEVICGMLLCKVMFKVP